VLSIVHGIFEWVQSEAAANFGTFVTGLAAVLVLVGSPFAVYKWKMQAVSQKRSEIAQSAYLKFKRFVRSMQYITSPAVMRYENDEYSEHPEPKIMHIFDSRAKRSEQEIKDFLKIWDESELYLGERVSELFERTWKNWVSIKANFTTYCQLIGMPDASEFYNKSLGEKARSDLESLLIEADQVIKPLTWYR